MSQRHPTKDVYSGLQNSIISQQLNVQSAATIYGSFISLFKTGYPHALELLSLKDDKLKTARLSSQKTNYVRNVANYFIDNNLFHNDWDNFSDKQIIDLLTEIKGVGRWTVQMLLMFNLKRPDVFPTLDFGIQQAMIKVYNLKQEKKQLKDEKEVIAEKWQPHRTVACLYLCAIKDI